jgi:ketosteroid isomerase-like protein
MSAEAVVRRYFATVADLGSSEAELRELLHPELVVVEYPNAITPQGAERDLEATVAGFLAGKQLLGRQSFEVHEALAQGDRVAVRATWSGTVGRDTPRLPAGTELVAHVAAFVELEDGLVRRHETFDCYEPLPA